jgi:predicted RNA-binding Zn-ribbon protein involved in translation (DUF1610 family)
MKKIMADDDKHPIRNLIVFPVIAGLILAALLYFIPRFNTFTFNTISIGWQYLLSAWQYLFANTLLPNSLLCLLVILAIPTVINVARYIFKSRASQGLNEPRISSYTTDTISGMTWRWEYITKSNMPSSDLWCFCPNCSNRLIFSTDLDVHLNQHTVFTCENCGFTSARFRGDRHDVFGMAARAIERKVTTGEWKNVVAKSSSN